MLKAATSDARMKHLAHGYEIGSPAQSLLSVSKHKANITELHPKVRPTCQFIFMERTYVETNNFQMPPSEMLIFCDLMTVSCEPPKMLAQDGCRFRKRCIIKLVDALKVTI